jgi:hypothetical protein
MSEAGPGEVEPTRDKWLDAGVAAAALAILFARKPHAFTEPQFFVEDATVYFQGQYEQGVAALFTPYFGYLHTIPRLVAQLAAGTPLEWRPGFYVGACLAAMLGLTVYIARSRLPLPTWQRRTLALAVFVLPLNPFVYLHLANLQWFGALALWVVLLQGPPRRRGEGAIDIAIVALAGLTGPFVVALAPLLPLRVWRFGWSFWEKLLGGVWIATASVQCATLLTIERTSRATWEHVTGGHLAGFAADFLFGAQGPEQFDVLPLLAPWLLLAGVIAVCVSLPSALRWHGAAALTAAAIFSALNLSRMETVIETADPFGSAIRYFLLPYAFLVWLFVLGLAGRGAGRWAAGAALCAVLLSTASAFQQPKPPNKHWARYCERIRAGLPVRVPINWYWAIELNTDRRDWVDADQRPRPRR